ncbi:FAD/NAD(P)-binding protein [candidate division KSB1 bacterium]
MGKKKQNPMLPDEYRIQKFKRETHDTFTLELEPANGRDIPLSRPGQFNMLYVFGVGEIPISISGDPNKRNPLVHTTRAVGTVTKVMKDLREGDVIGIRGPYGTHWPVESALGRDVLIIAGGIGLAPLRPVMYEILSRRDKYGKVVLLYGARTPEDILFKQQLERWRANFHLEVYVTVDRATGSWHGNVGVVTTLIKRAPFDPHMTTAMICGPEIMMRFSIMELLKRGVVEKDIYISMERNMKCGIGLCGHCQLGPEFVCKDGPVFRYTQMKDLISRREI